MLLRSRTPSPTKKTIPRKVRASTRSPAKANGNLEPVCGWSAWILWNSELRKWVTEKTAEIGRNRRNGATLKNEVVKACFDTVSRLGKLIPHDARSAHLLNEDPRSFIVVQIVEEPIDCRDEKDNIVTRTPVQTLFTWDDANGVETSSNAKILNVYSELGELSHLLFRVGDIILLKDSATVGDEHILINNSSQESRCQILYLMNQELDEPADFRIPFGTQEWSSYLRGWVKYFYVTPLIERGSQRCTLLRIVPQPQLRQSLSEKAQLSASTSSDVNKQVISDLAETRAARKRNTSSSLLVHDAKNRESFVAPNENDAPGNREEVLPKRRRIETDTAAGPIVGSEEMQRSSCSQESRSQIVRGNTLKELKDQYRASLARKAKTNINTSVTASDSEAGSHANALDDNAFIDSDGDDDNITLPNDPDYEVEDGQEDFNHFDENTRSRQAFTNRRYSNRVDVPLEGGFIRERLNESFEEQINVASTPRKLWAQREDWHSGMRPKLSKVKRYEYRNLADLENELLQEVVERTVRKQQNVYGVVTTVKHLEKGNFHTFLLRIMDDSGKQNVLVRLCTTDHDPKVGPKPHPNDIIRIHRACVQFEGAEMVISTAPHHNYTLFSYEDTLIAEIEIATSATTIHYTDADKKRIIDLRGFIKRTMEESGFEHSIQIEEASQSQDDDGQSHVVTHVQVRNHEVNEGVLSDDDALRGQQHEPRGQIGMEAQDQESGRNEEPVEPEDLHSSGEVISNLSAIIESEIRTQSEGFGGEINYNVRYPLHRSIIYETMNPDGCCLLEQLTKDQPEFNMKFWMLKSDYNSEDDIYIARVVDGTKSQFHRFVKLSSENEEEVEIKPYALYERTTTPDAACVYAPVVDVEIKNLSKNEPLAESLLTVVMAGRVRYVMKHVTLVDQPGPFTRKFRNVKLVVDALKTELMRYESCDKFTDMEIGSTRNQAKASTSKSVSLPPVAEQRKRDSALPSDDDNTRRTRSRSRSQPKTSSQDSSDKTLANKPTSSAASSSDDDSQSSYYTAGPSNSQNESGGVQTRDETAALYNMEVVEEVDEDDRFRMRAQAGEVETIAGRIENIPVANNHAGRPPKSSEGILRRSMRLFKQWTSGGEHK